MVVCPGALTFGCQKCPIVKMCPGKSVIGDYVDPKKAKADSEAERP